MATVEQRPGAQRRPGALSRLLHLVGWLLLALAPGPLWVAASGAVDFGADWRTASRESAGLAPAAPAHPAAVVQVYAARAFGWRGLFAVHCWIALKPYGASDYTVHQVLGWHRWAGRRVVDSRRDLPDRAWYGAQPVLLRDLRGPVAEALIPAIEAAVETYPSQHDYRLWPGPNSNTFVAWVARAVPALGLELPGTAIGKDYLHGAVVGRPPSGRGVQVSLAGLAGLTLAPAEGLQVNLLGAVFGVNPLRPSLTVPGLGPLPPPAPRREED